jgi:uncharacterized protein YbjT (DUF2867 family)
MKTKHRGSGLDRKPVLVVGASGQLGTRVVEQLARARVPVRAFVRPSSRHEHLLRLANQGVQVVHGDLTEPSSVMAACHGAGAIIATANAVAPTHGSTFRRVEDEGYVNLIGAARRQGCGRFVLISVPRTEVDAKVPLFRYKRLIEERLIASGHEHTILRAGPFMDDWFALIGSRLPARGDAAALIHRRWGFLQTFMGAVGNLIEQRGIAVVPGRADTQQAFVAIDDVAACLMAATTHAAARNAVLELAGPQRLSWADVAALFAQVLGRPVSVVSTPAWVFRLQQFAMRPFSEAASNIMGLNWIAAQTMPLADSGTGTGTAALLGVPSMTTAEQFLRAKATLPA